MAAAVNVTPGLRILAFRKRLQSAASCDACPLPTRIWRSSAARAGALLRAGRPLLGRSALLGCGPLPGRRGLASGCAVRVGRLDLALERLERRPHVAAHER